MKTRSLSRYALVLGLLLAGQAAAWGQPVEAEKLRALLLIDTFTDGIGASVEKDGITMENFLKAGIPADKLEITTLTGNQVTPQNALNYYRNVTKNPNQVLLCYYAGHGATDPTRGHYLALKNGNLFRKDLLAEMQKCNPRLVVVLTDCCSNFLPTDRSTPRPRVIPPNQFHPVMRALFFQHQGVVDITGAQDGTSSYGDNDYGGIFTRSLYATFYYPDGRWKTEAGGFVKWQDYFPRVRTETETTFVNWAREMRAKGSIVEQDSQSPRAFTLPGALAMQKWKVGLSVVRTPESNGVKIQKVFPGTPSERLGLEPGDVILKIDDQPLRSAADFGRLIDASTTGRLRLEIRDVRSGQTIRKEIQLQN